MYKERYTIITYSYIVDYEHADSDLVDESQTTGDLFDAIRAYDSDSWDNVDYRESTEQGTGSIILYPADWQTDSSTGEVTYDNIVITGKLQHIYHLDNYLHARKHRKVS